MIKVPVALLCALAFCSLAPAQSNPWPAVQALSPGASLQVHLLGGNVVKGKLAAITPLGVDLQTSPNSTRYIARARITQVYLTKKSHRENYIARDTLLGAGYGATGGAIYGAVAYQKCYGGAANGCKTRAHDIAVGAALIGAVGALFGAAIGPLRSLAHHSTTLIYQRNSSSPHVLPRTPTQQNSAISSLHNFDRRAASACA